MMVLPRAVLVSAIAATVACAGSAPRNQTAAPRFDVVEASIADMHAAMRARQLTARDLVDAYLARIASIDRAGPSLNAITSIHPRAGAIADSLDALFARTGEFVGPLHGIPIIVKDNYDTFDLPTTAGSRSLADALPVRDATMVRLLRAAGAIVLAKSNMAEFAFSPYETVGSAHPGYTFNPYALNRVPAGSSGGTAAAVAANLGAAGLGTDTGNSIRGPSSHTALVGIRPTMGLTSRAGIVPLFLERDVGGPMARTVADAALLLQVLAGSDAADPVTADAAAHIPARYADHLRTDALRGVRLGVVRRFTSTETADTSVIRVFDDALRALTELGAVLVDPVELPVLDSVRASLCSSFKYDLETYLRSRPGVPQTLDSILAGGRFHVSVRPRIEALVRDTSAQEAGRCAQARESRERFRAGMRAALDAQRLDGLVYPTWSNAPRLIGDLTSPHGDNNQVLSPWTGWPAITVPMGYSYGSLPAGLQFLSWDWREGELFGWAYAYEQRTRWRRAP